MNYRRVYIPNSFVHIIITSYDRKPIFIDNIKILRKAFKKTMQYYKFEIVAVCILPNHIHLLLNPENITEYSKIISSVKHSFSYDVGHVCPTYLYAHLEYLRTILLQIVPMTDIEGSHKKKTSEDVFFYA